MKQTLGSPPARAAKGKRRPLTGHGVWRVAPLAESNGIIARLSGALKISPVCARILARRGLDSPERAEAFLSRGLDQLHDPGLLPDMEQAVARIAAAVEKGQKILLFGDYDCDGITATALLERFFRVVKTRVRNGFQVQARVPERKHGYGLSAAAVKEILAHKPDLLITLDNGTTAHESLNALAQAGIDCIVADHHHAAEKLPRAVAVINPKRGDSRYPFDELCGAGIAFKLAWALAVYFSHNRKVTPEFRAFLLDAIALAGIGTLADVVPLTGENRVLAHNGLVALAKTRLPGLRALLAHCKVEGSPRASEVAFRLAPRINAAGRCGDVAEALELLLTEDSARAEQLAATLDGYNTERQGIEDRILDEARRQALAELESSPNCPAFVLDSEEWHAGVIGIVASRIVEEFHRPALLLSVDRAAKLARGSGRSIKGLHLAEALAESAEHLLQFGGHSAAAGVSIASEKIAAFRAAFKGTAAAALSAEDLLPSLHIDEEIALHDVTAKLCADLDRFEPCGAGNPRPRLAAYGVAVSAPPALMGKDENHICFYARQDRAARRVIAFHAAEHFNALCDLCHGGALDIAFRPQINTYRGEHTVELILEAFRKSEVRP